MGSTNALMIISSDGHAIPKMPEFRPYLEERYLEDFDEFMTAWEPGWRNHDLNHLGNIIDRRHLDHWKEHMIDSGRAENYDDPDRRLAEMDREGITAEVLFADFGVPFQIWGSIKSANFPFLKGERREEYLAAGMRAFNRWLADFVAASPDRWRGLASISWQQPSEAIITDLRQAHAAGLVGITLPMFERERPLYHPDYDTVWATIEELGLVVHSHSGMSSASRYAFERPYHHPNLAIEFRLMINEIVFFCQNILSDMIWGRVFEKHPSLQMVFTEQGSYWVVPALEAMDYSYEGSYFRSDYKDLVPLRPSEYFERQCYLGSSLFTRAEMEARKEIGVDKMMLGCDLPHHEGTVVETTRDYVRATLGAAGVSEAEARRMMCETAAALYGFDTDALAPIAQRLDVRPDDVLKAPDQNLYTHGDVHKPLALV